jgi:hypothetical protein
MTTLAEGERVLRAELTPIGAMRTKPRVPDDDFPFTKYREATLMRTKLRKETKCCRCWGPLKVGEIAWRTLTENIRRGVCRSQRWHLSHFKNGQEYDD